MKSRCVRSILVGGMYVVACATSLAAQTREARYLERDPESAREQRAPLPAAAAFTFEGLVFDSTGTPARGAIVVTSSGGQAVVDAEGAYTLEIELGPAVERVQVTAVNKGAKSQVASRSVEVFPSGGRVDVGLLRLAQGGSCPPSWVPTFGGVTGTVGDVTALAVFDDGSGNALYASGAFIQAGSVPATRIARWDGTEWSVLGSGLNDRARALLVFDDGGGEALYVAGDFTQAGGASANRIAKWDGASWSTLGSGLNDSVYDLAVFDDGGGEAIHVGGSFTQAGGAAADYVAKWDGVAWSSLGNGLNDQVFALCVFDDGGGEDLYMGGDFTMTGDGGFMRRMTRWNGTTYSQIGIVDDSVLDLIVFDDGGGEALYLGGSFVRAGSQLNANFIASWNGSGWSSLGAGMEDSVYALGVFDDGGGAALYAAGDFTMAGGFPAQSIAKWDGANWAGLGDGIAHSARALVVFDDGGGEVLCVAGSGAPAVNNVGLWDGSSWSVPGEGLDQAVLDLEVFDDGSGETLYVAGSFLFAGGEEATHIAEWDGTGWSTLGSGLVGTGGTSGWGRALEVFDDGGGEALYAAGEFDLAGGVSAEKIAKWDGSGWSPLGAGLTFGPGCPSCTATVRVLEVFDDGGGPALYAGGSFDTAGGVAANRIAKWDGASWSALGTGILGFLSAMAVFDGGGGPELYVAGDILSVGGTPVNNMGKWDGTNWSVAPDGPQGVDAVVRAMKVFDDGGGPALYVGGTFESVGGISTSGIAKWDGTSWSAVGGGIPSADLDGVWTLEVFDDGDGPALYAGGRFTSAGGSAANSIAKWDGTSWVPLGGGIGGINDFVLALGVFDDGGGDALYAGGDYTLAYDSGDSALAKWDPAPADVTAPVLSCPGDLVITLDSRAPASGGPATTVDFSVSATDDCDSNPSVVSVPPSGSVFPWGTTTVTSMAHDTAGNMSMCTFDVTVRARVSVVK